MTIEIQDDELLKTPNGISPSPGTCDGYEKKEETK